MLRPWTPQLVRLPRPAGGRYCDVPAGGATEQNGPIQTVSRTQPGDPSAGARESDRARLPDRYTSQASAREPWKRRAWTLDGACCLSSPPNSLSAHRGAGAVRRSSGLPRQPGGAGLSPAASLLFRRIPSRDPPCRAAGVLAAAPKRQQLAGFRSVASAARGTSPTGLWMARRSRPCEWPPAVSPRKQPAAQADGDARSAPWSCRAAAPGIRVQPASIRQKSAWNWSSRTPSKKPRFLGNRGLEEEEILREASARAAQATSLVLYRAMI